MNRRRAPALACALVLALGCCGSAEVHAHDLDTNTARVSLRDGNVTVYADIDVVAWVDAMDTSVASRGAVELGELGPAALAKRSAAARRQLAQELRIELDGERAAFRLREFPSDGELVRLAARNLVAEQIDDHAHRQRSRIVIDLTEPGLAPARVRLTVPESWGEVLVNFVQPQTQLASPGQPCEFSVLLSREPPISELEPANLAPQSPTSKRGTTLALVGKTLGSFIAGLLCATLIWRRRQRRETP